MTDYRAVEYIPPNRDEFISHYYQDVQDIGVKLYKENGTVESDDISQAIFEEVIRSYDKAFADLDRAATLFRLWRAGKSYVKRESIDYMYFSGGFVYTPKIVRDLMEAQFYMLQPVVAGSDAQASNIDVQTAFERLAERKREVLLRRYRDGVAPSDMARGDKLVLYRAIDEMTDSLNKRAPQSREELEAA